MLVPSGNYAVQGAFFRYRLTDRQCHEHFRTCSGAAAGVLRTKSTLAACLATSEAVDLCPMYHLYRLQDRTGVWNGPAPVGSSNMIQVKCLTLLLQPFLPGRWRSSVEFGTFSLHQALDCACAHAGRMQTLLRP